MTTFKYCFQKRLLNSFLNLQQVRFYPRWSHRRPVRVYTPEEYEAIQKGNIKREKNEDTFTPKIENNNCEIIERITAKNEETAKTDNVSEQNFGFEKITAPKRVNLRKPAHKKEIPKVDMLETIIDVDGNLVYTKMKDKDIRITYVIICKL